MRETTINLIKWEMNFSALAFFLINALGGVVWAQTDTTYKVVDTGQILYYNNSTTITAPSSGESFYGQDANYSGNVSSYINNGNGTITDNVTGLMWQQSPDRNGDGTIDYDDKLTYYQAVDSAASFNTGGYSDWRLPTIKELYSLIMFYGAEPNPTATSQGSAVPFIDTDYFDFGYGDLSAGERIIDAQYASSTLYVSTTMSGYQTMFGVNFADGRIKGYPTDTNIIVSTMEMKFYVLYVRDNTDYGKNEFVDNGDGTITDNATGLMLMQNDNGSGVLWENALSYTESLGYAGYTDWRLPNAKELQSIVDYTRSPATTSSAAIDTVFNCTSITNEAGNADYPFYWNSTTHCSQTTSSGTSAAYLSFGRAMGYMSIYGGWVDVHGAGAQRSDPKTGNPDAYPYGHGPQGDAIRIYNYVRLVRNVGTVLEPEAEFGFTPTSPTVGQTVQFIDSSTNNPTSWQWSFGDGETSIVQNPSHAFDAAGNFTVTLTVSNSAGSDSISHSIIVVTVGNIEGTLFYDSNQNGIYDNDELGMLGWKVYLNGTTIDSTLTDTSGYYSFNNVSAGTFHLYTENRDGWTQTIPTAAETTITIGSTTDFTINFGKYCSTAQFYHVRQCWNLISLPRQANTLKTVLFPTAISEAYAYNGSYVARDTLQCGVGYWLKFPSDQYVCIVGDILFSDTVDVQEGWNMIGSLSSPISVVEIGASSPDITLSNFFGYNCGYMVVDTVEPCQGYWVKASQSGQLYLNVSGIAHAANKVRIVNNGEMPPPPPEFSGVSLKALPNSFVLMQNYPNPFNPTTTFRYELTTDARIRLTVYDIVGCEVVTVVNGEQQQQGMHEVCFDASALASGVYYYRFTAQPAIGNSYFETRKFTLVK